MNNNVLSKENKYSGDNLRKRKVDENFMTENISKTSDYCEREQDSNLSLTIYEDESDINYFNKSTRKRIMNSSINKRSPLSTINQQNRNSETDTQIPSSSTSKLDETFYKRLQQKSPPIDPFSRLSDEVLLHIFQYLPKKALQRIALVNTRFSRVVVDESLWIRLDLGNRALRAGGVGTVISRGLIILRLAQARIQRPIFDSDIDLEGYQSKLKYLDLSLASIDTSSLAQLLSVCRLLKKLSLEQLTVDFNVCKEISENRNLEVLNLSMCEGLTKGGITIMMVNLQSLTALNIAWASLKNECVNAFISNMPSTLMRLNIAGNRRSFEDSYIQTLVKRCPNIVELDVSDCTLLTSETIPAVSTLNKLEYLSLSRCYNIPMASYLTLSTMDSLAYLDVFGMLSDSGIQMLEKTFKNIAINKFIHSSVARPTVMPRRTSIWGLRTRD